MLVKSITVAVRSKVWVCGSSIGRIAGSNSAESTDVRLLCVLCVVKVAVFTTSRSLVRRNPVDFVCLNLLAPELFF